MLSLDLSGKNAFVAGVADDRGFGWAIARHLAAAGASVRVGTWPPALGIFTKSLERGKLDQSLPGDAEGEWSPAKIYPLDAEYDTADAVPVDVAENKRYAGLDGYTISEVAEQLGADLQGEGSGKLDILVPSLANGPEVQNDLLDTSRSGYLAAIGASAYSLVSMVQRFGPIMSDGGAVVSLSYLAAERAIPGYGGGMSSAKAALEGDTRTLAFEAGRRFGIRVNAISAGPLASRAAKAIGTIERMVDYYAENAPIQKELEADHVGATAAFLCSPLAAAVAGETLHVDMGYHAMGMIADPDLLAED